MRADVIRVVLADDHAVVRAGLRAVLTAARDIEIVGEASTGREFKMPVLHLAQLVGVAAGLEEAELKFKRHIVDPRPALERLEA